MPTAKAEKSKKAIHNSTLTELCLPKLFFIGMMGAGKTYWANKLKKKLKVAAYDLDALVEMMEEKTITEIFAEDGEEYFRKAEAKMLRLFIEKKQFILSCGGGTPCHHDNMKWMNNQGITIWIDEPIEALAARLVKEKAHRPLIKDLDDTAISEFLQTKMNERASYYSHSAYRLRGDQLSEKVFLKIIKDHA